MIEDTGNLLWNACLILLAQHKSLASAEEIFSGTHAVSTTAPD
jgi:hypothetical protein